LNEAIRLDPKSLSAFYFRALAYVAKQDYDRAIADYTEAVRLNPKFATAFRRRGISYAAKQNYDDAIASLNDAVRLDKSAGAVLWLYLIRARFGAQTAASELETNAKNLNQADWPYPLVEYSLAAKHSKRHSPLQPNPMNAVQHSSMSENGSCCETTTWPPKGA
jgi:lipoprotein NlpI